MTLSAKTRNQKKLDPKYSKFKSKNQQIRVVNKKDGVIKVSQNPKRGMIEDMDGGQREKVVESKPRTKPDDLVIAGKQDDDKPRGMYSRRTLAFLARHGLKDVGQQDDENENEKDSRKGRALKRDARGKKRVQAQDRENRAERRALRLAREWEQKREQEMEHRKVILDYYEKHMEEQKDELDRTSVEKNITTLIEKSRQVRVLIQDLKLSQSEPPEETPVQEEDDIPSTEIREKQLSPVQEEEDSSESENEEREAEDREKMPPPKAKSSTEKSEKELRIEAREKRREEEERKREEEYWPVWDEIPKEKKKRKRTCDRIVFKKSDYNMTDSDESSYEEEEEESRYAPARTSAPSPPKPAPSSKPAKFIPMWAQGELLEQALEKQSDHNSFDLDALFFLVPTPDMKLMFPKKKKKWRRTSSAIWLAPPPASFRVC